NRRGGIGGLKGLDAIGMRDGVGAARGEIGGAHADTGEDDLVAGLGDAVEEGALEGDGQQTRLAVRSRELRARPVIAGLDGEVVRKGDRLVRIGNWERRIADEVEAGLQPEEGRVLVVEREPVHGADGPEFEEWHGARLGVRPRSEAQEEQQQRRERPIQLRSHCVLRFEYTCGPYWLAARPAKS